MIGLGTSRAESMALQIEQRIIAGTLEAEQRIGTKDELHDTFGVAIGTVNVAMRLLESRGLIELKPGPGGGVFVAGSSARVRLSNLILGFRAGDVPGADWLAVQEALEPLVCCEAARYRSAADVEDLRAILERMRLRLDRPEDLLELNRALHRRKARICHNVTLKGLYLTLLDHVQDAIAQLYRAPGFDARQCFEAHCRQVEAIAAGSAQ